MKVDIALSPNWDKMKKRFSDLPPQIDKGASEGIKKAAVHVSNLSKLEITRMRAVRTGRLRASIYPEIHEYEASIQPKTDYAIYVHEGLGTNKKYGRRPFMEAGLEDARPYIQKLFNNEVQLAIKKTKVIGT